MKSLNRFPEKCTLLMEQIYEQVNKGNICLTENELGTIAGLYYIAKQKDSLANFDKSHIDMDRLKNIVPLDTRQHI